MMMPQSKSAETLLNNSSSPSSSSSEAVYQNQLHSESLYEIVPAAAATPFVRNYAGGPGDVVRGLQAWLPDSYCQILRTVCVWPFGLLDYGSAMLRCKI